MTDDLLLKSIRDGRIMHALLFTGPDGGGRDEAARRAAAVYCLDKDNPELLKECPNFIEVGPNEKGVIDVNSARALREAAKIRSFSGGRRAFFISQAHRMNDSAENALLKIIEEPPENTMLILEGREGGILPTILSRCAIRRIGGIAPGTLTNQLVLEGFDPKAAERAARLSGGVPGRARLYLTPEYAEFVKDASVILNLAILARTAPIAEGRSLLEKEFFKEPEQKPDKKKKAAKKEEEEEADAGAKKKAKMRRVLEMLLEYAQYMLRDALLIKENIGVMCPDASQLSKRIAEVKSEGELLNFIDAIQRAYRANAEEADPARILDILLLDFGGTERKPS